MNARSYLALAGRILLALIFVVAGINKVVHWSDSVGYMAASGLPAVPLLLVAAIAIELVGATMLLIGYKTEISSLVLFAYLIPVTLVFHSFWRFHGMEAQMQLVNFLKNLSIMGGLLGLAATAPSRVSVDNALMHRRPPPGATPSHA